MYKRAIFTVFILIILGGFSAAFGDTSIEWGNLQWPFATQTLVGEPTENIYGQVYMSGVTDDEGQGEGITAEVGYGAVDTDPTTWTNWTEAVYNVDAGPNDEYMGNLVVNVAGTYHYTYRYMYEGDEDYYFASERGTLTVNEQPPPQVNITFQVDMNYVDEISPDGVHIAGSFQGWDPGATEMFDNDGDGVYSITIELTAGDYHEYKYINGNQWGQDESNNRSLSVPDTDTVLEPVYFNNIGPEVADITFTAIDSTFSYVNIKIKGTMTDWTPEPMYDDGTNGDEIAGDHIWTVIIYGVNQGDHEWGVLEDDGSEWGIWLIEGPNLQFSVDEEGNVTGQTSYTILPNSIVNNSFIDVPAKFRLEQNYPNPFNPTTFIRFNLPKQNKVALNIYSLDGALVKRLIDGSLGAGSHTIIWNGEDSSGQSAPGGLYFYSLDAGGQKAVKTMMLLK